jgi:aerobic carbon-monoxide dehydrogenase small subunit
LYNLTLTINDEPVTRAIDSTVLLVDLLRETLNLKGTHIGCDTAQCGACTVLIDGASVKACSVLALQMTGAAVTTVEGLTSSERPSNVQQAFSSAHALQCGFCTPGMIMRTHEIMAQGKVLSRAQIAHELEGNLCRCTGYVPIIDAIEALCKLD